MGRHANKTEIQQWRRDYWRLRKKYSNKEIASKLGVDPGNLSAMGRGAVNKEGKPKNPGSEFIKQFYMSYPELTGSSESPGSPASSEDQPANPNHNKNSQYAQGGPPLSAMEEPATQVHFMNWEDPVWMRNELFSQLKRNDEFYRTEFSKMTDTGLTTVRAFHKVAENNLIQSQELAFYRKQTNPGPDKTAIQ